MADPLPNQETIDQLRRMVEETIARGTTLAEAVPGAGSRRLHSALSWATSMLSRTPEQMARDFHHHQLQHHLLALGNWRLTIAECRIDPFGVPGLVVTARGVPGAARIVAYGVEPGGRRSYEAVPLTGDPRDAGYELLIAKQPPDRWASGPEIHLHTADPAEIARAVAAWCDAVPLPVLEVPPLGPGDLKAAAGAGGDARGDRGRSGGGSRLVGPRTCCRARSRRAKRAASRADPGPRDHRPDCGRRGGAGGRLGGDRRPATPGERAARCARAVGARRGCGTGSLSQYL
jgi:hypothetical protein